MNNILKYSVMSQGSPTIRTTKQTIKVLVHLTTKIAIKSNSITPFGGVFYAMDEFHRLGIDSLIDKSLGLRSCLAGYQYSEIISSLFWIYYCGGDRWVLNLYSDKPYKLFWSS